MHILKAILLFGLFGIVILATVQFFNNIGKGHFTVNEEGRRVQVWLDKTKCEDCTACKQQLKARAKLEVLQAACPADALSWSFE